MHSLWTSNMRCLVGTKSTKCTLHPMKYGDKDCCHAWCITFIVIISTTRIIITTRATLTGQQQRHHHYRTLKSRLLGPVIKLIWRDPFNDHHNPPSAQSDDRFIVKLTTPVLSATSLTATQNLPHYPHFSSWFQQPTLSNTDLLTTRCEWFAVPNANPHTNTHEEKGRGSGTGHRNCIITSHCKLTVITRNWLCNNTTTRPAPNRCLEL